MLREQVAVTSDLPKVRDHLGYDLEKEIDMADLFTILVSQKKLILFGTLVPVILTAISFILLPKEYRLSYTYPLTINEQDFTIIQEQFYGPDNLKVLKERFREENTDTPFPRSDNLRQYVSFETAAPSSVSSPQTPSNSGGYLQMHITMRSQTSLPILAELFRKDFEQLFSWHAERQALIGKIVSLKNKMVHIEDSRYSQKLNLKKAKSIYARLKNVEIGSSELLPKEIIIQFDHSGEDNDYLPIPYQVQAFQTRIIRLEEEIEAGKESYIHYSDQLRELETLLDRLGQQRPSAFSLKAFRLFLVEQLTRYGRNDSDTPDFLKAYTKEVENRLSVLEPRVENPSIHTLPRHAIRKLALVSAMAFAISVFSAFLYETQRQRKLLKPEH